MTSHRMAVALAMIVPLLVDTGLSAQDANTLDRHLQHQQWQRVQDHQNQTRRMSPRERTGRDSVRDSSSELCSADALPAEERRRMEAEYVRRVGEDGKASADAWVREQGRQFRLRLVAAGTCSDQSSEAQVADQRAEETGEGGCRMVMRPVAGLVGAPMTMGMVTECD